MLPQPPDHHVHIEDIIRIIRVRMRNGMGMREIARDLGRFIPGDELYVYYVAAALMERDYGRKDSLLK